MPPVECLSRRRRSVCGPTLFVEGDIVSVSFRAAVDTEVKTADAVFAGFRAAAVVEVSG